MTLARGLDAVWFVFVFTLPGFVVAWMVSCFCLKWVRFRLNGFVFFFKLGAFAREWMVRVFLQIGCVFMGHIMRTVVILDWVRVLRL